MAMRKLRIPKRTRGAAEKIEAGSGPAWERVLGRVVYVLTTVQETSVGPRLKPLNALKVTVVVQGHLKGQSKLDDWVIEFTSPNVLIDELKRAQSSGESVGVRFTRRVDDTTEIPVDKILSVAVRAKDFEPY